MSSVLKERFSTKESVAYKNSTSDMSDLSGDQLNGVELHKEAKELEEESPQDARPANEKKWLLVLAVHFCNVLYSSCFWINVGVYPVWQYRLFNIMKYCSLYKCYVMIIQLCIM